MSVDALFTSTNIISVGVATLAVNVTTNTLHSLFKFPPKFTAFIAALVIAYVVVAIETGPAWYEWVLAFFKACLLFCSATGINELGAAATGNPPGSGFAGGKGFIRSWFS